MKTKQFEVKKVKGNGVVTAVFATLNVIDADKDVTKNGAFGEQEAPILPAHNWSHAPLGKAKIREEGDEAVAEMSFNLDSESGKEWYSALKFDFENGTKPLQQYSYGYDIVKSSQGEFEGEKVQFLEGLKVNEVSPVLLGAGVNTRSLAVKSGLIEEEEKKTLKEDFESSLAVLSGFNTRIKALATLREKEGRNLTEENRDRLKTLLKSLEEITGDIGDLLEHDPSNKGKALVEFVRLQQLRLEHRL